MTDIMNKANARLFTAFIVIIAAGLSILVIKARAYAQQESVQITNHQAGDGLRAVSRSAFKETKNEIR